jgi:hypothetical protein
LNVIHVVVWFSECRKSAQWPAVRKIRGEISVRCR